MGKLTETIWKLAEPIAAAAGCSIWDVEYVKEAGTWFLRVYIDKTEGVGIADCEAVSRALDPILDERDVIPGSYTFEVSSAGAERQLKRERDFLQFIGHPVAVRLYRAVDGTKEKLGTLTGYSGGDVEIEADGGVLRFSKADVAVVKLRIV